MTTITTPLRRIYRAIRHNDVPAGESPSRPFTVTRIWLALMLIATALLAWASIYSLVNNTTSVQEPQTLGTELWRYWLPVALIQVLPIPFAARRPAVACAVSAAGMLMLVFSQPNNALNADWFWAWPLTGWAVFVLLATVLAATRPRRYAVGVWLVGLAILGMPFVVHPWPSGGQVPWVQTGQNPWTLGGQGIPMSGLAWPLTAVVLTVALVIGDLLRTRTAVLDRLRTSERTRRAEHAEHAVHAERARIARELHDVVAHHMSMVAIQAEAAPIREPDLPESTRHSLTAIRRSSLLALSEMRRTIGLLRDEQDAVELAPQPGLDQLPALVDAARVAGMDIELTLPDDLPALEPGVAISAYRITQEALSNASRHAPGAHVAVRVELHDDTLRLSVTNDGRITGQPGPRGGGHGLLGMHERAAMLDGELHVGDLADGGFEIRADLPLSGER
jgi:signal transduction histidine kinase